MDLIKWIEKNSFKVIDDELSTHIDKLESLKSDKEKLITKINFFITLILNNQVKKKANTILR